MADWRQIQARIRKARAAPDSTVQLGALYERTRDAMVAFELAKAHEKAGDSVTAVQWYTTAYERFRRAQWRTKAQEALTRLGAPIPALLPPTGESSEEPRPAEAEAAATPVGDNQMEIFSRSPQLLAPAVASEPDEEGQTEVNGNSVEGSESSTVTAGALAGAIKRRRRGHRGGRGRRRGGKVPGAPPAPRSAQKTSASPVPMREPEEDAPASQIERAPSSRWEERATPPARGIPSREPVEEAAPARAGLQMKGRAGDPGLASRMAQLESQLRRLLASDLHSMDEAAQAPAGPGVFLVTDTDQTCYYHVEACQTLRIGIANLLRADRRAPRGAETLRTKFAEDLGISEAQVGKYIDKHGAVRWIQLDEGAANLAHFAIAVLRPVLDQA
jgi:hypothetical protein